MTSRIEEMRAQIHATPMPPAPVPVRARVRFSRRMGLISGGVLGLGLAAAAAIVIFAIGDGSSPAPAFAAITQVQNGERTVTITLRAERDIPKLNAQLKSEHTHVRVVPIIKGCHAPVREVLRHDKVAPGPPKTIRSRPNYIGKSEVFISQETIATATSPGVTRVVAVSPNGHLFGWVTDVLGPAPSCAGVGAPVYLPHGYSAG